MGVIDNAMNGIEAPKSRSSYLDDVLDQAVAPSRKQTGSTGIEDVTRKPAFPTQGQDIQYNEGNDARDAILIKFGAGLTRAGQGAKQLSLQVAEAIPALEEMGFIDSGATATYTKLVQKDREFFDKAFKAEFGDSWVYDLAEVAGEIAPFLAVPGMNVQSMAGRVALQGAAGAAGGALTFADTPDQRVQNTVAGGTLGAAASPVLSLLGRMRRFVSGSLGRPLAGAAEGRAGAERMRVTDRFGKVQTGTAGDQLAGIEASAIERSRKLADEGFRVFDEASEVLGEQIPVKITNLTDDPFLRNMEELAGMSTKGSRVIQEVELQQVDTTLKFWNKTIEGLEKKQAGSASFASDVQAAFKETMEGSDGLLTLRANKAAADFAAVDRASGNARQIPVENLVRTIDKHISDLQMEAGRENLLGKRAQATLKELQGLRGALEGASGVLGPNGQPIAGQAGVVTAKELQKLLNQYGKASQGSGRLFTDKVDRAQDLAVSKDLFKATMKDLDAAAGLNIPGSTELKVARNNYRAMTDKVREVQNSALGKLFNAKGELTREAIETSFLKMNASEIKSAMSVLEKADPLMKLKLQHLYLMEMIGKASTEGPFSKIPFSPGRMFDLLRNDAKFRSVFSTPEELKMVKLGLDLTKRVVDNVGASTPSGALPRLKNIAGVAASMDATFMSRLFAEIFLPNRLLTSVLTEKGIRNIQQSATKANTSVGIPLAIGAGTADEQSVQ